MTQNLERPTSHPEPQSSQIVAPYQPNTGERQRIVLNERSNTLQEQLSGKNFGPNDTISCDYPDTKPSSKIPFILDIAKKELTI
jgi:hypothetical protein